MKTDTILLPGDCLEIVPTLPRESFDLILIDPPYGITACKWDSIIPFSSYMVIDKKIVYRDEYLKMMMKSSMSLLRFYEQIFEDNCKPGMWDIIRWAIKPAGAVVIFGCQPFSSALVMSNPKWFKYDITIIKNSPTGFLNAKKQPLRITEAANVFYNNQCKYNPQMTTGRDYYTCRAGQKKSKNYGKQKDVTTVNNGYRYPVNAIFSLWKTEGIHETEKPVDLLSGIIKTYTDPGDNVLDFCMGSGSTGVAAKMTGRNFTGIEKEKKYFKIAQQRINEINPLLPI